MTIKLGPFELDRPIGRGGMGEVWSGRHVEQDIPVAIKVLTREGARHEAFADAFRNEVLSIARLHHPGIIMLLDYGVIEPRTAISSSGRLVEASPFIAMELARYGSLREYMGSLRWPELKAVLLTILDALAHAHARGVIHRDLKPQNILLGCGEADAIKLTDFGLAHTSVSDDEERSDEVEAGWGTPAYMAPEQFRGLWRDYGPWTDLYALGCMAFELATGDVPFTGNSKWTLGRGHIMGEIPRMFPRFPVPSGFEGWVVRLLQKEPHHRFVRAADAALALLALGDVENSSEHDRQVFTGRFGSVESEIIPEQDAALAYLTQAVDSSLLEAELEQDARAHQSGEGLQDRIVSRESGMFMVPERREGSPAQIFVGEPGRAIATDEYAATVLESGPSFIEDIVDEFEEGVAPQATLEEFIVPSVVNSPPVPLSWRRRSTVPASLRLAGAGLGLFGLRELRLVGRDAERDMLWQVLREVHDTGQPRAVVLRGSSGVGKSKLARWFCARAHELGSATVFKAVHSPMRAPVDGLMPMFSRHLRTFGLGREATFERTRRYLERLWVQEPAEWELLTDIISPEVDLEREQGMASIGSYQRAYSPQQRHAVLLRMLEREAEDRPLILWMDDIQWGAEAALFAKRLIEEAENHPEALPVVVLMTVRDDALEADSLEAMILDQIGTSNHCYTVGLSELEQGSVDELIHELLALEPGLARQIMERARGNPLFVAQLVGELVSADKLEVGATGFQLKSDEVLSLPDDLHELWRARLARVLSKYGDEQQICLEVGCALGVEVSFVEWVNACKHCSTTIEHSLYDELFARGILVQTRDGWAFAHGLLRESLERSARDAGRWEQVNRACATMILSVYQPGFQDYYERCARHLLEAREYQQALEPMYFASRARVEISDFDAALAWLDERDRLIAVLGLADSDARRGMGDLLRASIADHQGSYLDARRWAVSVIDAARAHGWKHLYARAHIAAAFATLHRGATEEAESLFEVARATDQHQHLEGPSQVQLDAEIGLARVAQRRGELRTAAERFGNAKQWAELISDRLAVATCLNGLGDVARQARDLSAARERARRALEITEELGNHILIADCYNDLSEVERLEGDYERAAEYANKAAALYKSVGSTQSRRARRNIAYIEMFRGNYEVALGLFTALAEHFRRNHDFGQLSLVVVGMLPCLAALERVPELRAQLSLTDRLLSSTSRRDDDVWIACDIAARLLDARGFTADAERVREVARRYAPSMGE